MRDAESGEETSTELEGLLRDGPIERVVLCGLATDYCVKATALDAVRLGFASRCSARRSPRSNLAPDDGDRALAEMAEAGVSAAPEAPTQPPQRRDRATSTAPARTATAPMTTHARSAVMKLRGAKGRLSPWAIQTRPAQDHEHAEHGDADPHAPIVPVNCDLRSHARSRNTPRVKAADERRHQPFPSSPLHHVQPSASGQWQDPGPASSERTRRGPIIVGRGPGDLHRSGDHLQRLWNRLRLFRVRAGVLRGEGLLVRSEAMLVMPSSAPGIRRRRGKQLRQRRRLQRGRGLRSTA